MNFIHNPWFYLPIERPYYSSLLFCFHYAGGDANFFQDWADKLPDDVQLVAIQLPGRSTRKEEPCITNIDELTTKLINALIPLLNKPYIFLGHSMGALIGYEVLQNLRKLKVLLPACFVASASSAPHLLGTNINGLKRIKIFGELYQADVSLLESWHYQTEEIFNIPFLICGGIADLFIPYNNLVEWRVHTKADFSVHLYNGGHNYIVAHKEKIITNFLPYLRSKITLD